MYTLRPGSESARVEDRHAALLTIGDRYAPQVAGLARFPIVERVRFRSRVRLATGVRLFGSGRRVAGVLYAAAGLLQWPFRTELLRWRAARSVPSAAS